MKLDTSFFKGPYSKIGGASCEFKQPMLSYMGQLLAKGEVAKWQTQPDPVNLLCNALTLLCVLQTTTGITTL